MSITIQSVPYRGAYSSACVLLLFLFYAAGLSQCAEIRCNPNQVGSNRVLQKCPGHQMCTPRGVCEPIPDEAAEAKRLRNFRPLPASLRESIMLALGRSSENAPRNREDGTPTKDDGKQTSEPLIHANQTLISSGQPLPAPAHAFAGEFHVVGDSGVPAMHAALMPNGKVVFLDKIETYTQLRLDNGELAYSTEWDPESGQLVPLSYKTNAFCSGGSFLASGTLVSLGGNGPLPEIAPSISDGFDGIRYLTRSLSMDDDNNESWSEPGNVLASKRWYASAQTMADGTIFVASGSLNGLDPAKSENNNPTYEVLDRTGVSSGSNVPLAILLRNEPYFMYPFLHLLRDGNLFIFTAKSSQLFDVANNVVVKELPDLAGMYRTYPNTGGSVLLPLSPEADYEPEILICGGGAYQDLPSPTDPTCGKIKALEQGAEWEMDAMPESRGMVEGTILPDGTVLWLNGAQRGAEGFGIADTPALDALLYEPKAEQGKRWSKAGTSVIPRLYHSVALLLLDGRVAIAGSNPNEMPVLADQVNPANPARAFPTEFRVEIYTPPYLIGDRAGRRPDGIGLSTDKLTADGSTFEIQFKAPEGAKEVKVCLYHGGFVTHALHMGQRMVWLESEGWQTGGVTQKLEVRMPAQEYGGRVLPPGPYVVFVVVDGVPGIGKFVLVS